MTWQSAGHSSSLPGWPSTATLPADLNLPFAVSDAARIAALFTRRFGYQRVLPELGQNPTTDALRRGLAGWLSGADRRPDDVVVIYFAGHGAKSSDGRHYLLCADSDFTALTASALASDDLLRLWVDAGRPVRNLLFVIDACFSGAGVKKMIEVAREVAAVQRSDDFLDGVAVLAAARSRDEAEESLFVDVFERSIDTARVGQRQRFLGLDGLADAINADLVARRRSQRAVCYPVASHVPPPFVPNPGYRPDAPPEGVDLATQRRLRRRDLIEHFDPRSRGVESAADAGNYFSGRTAVLTDIVSWLTAAKGDGKGRVVTGSPGSGKSAVIGRLVTLADPEKRDELNLSDLPAASIPPAGCVGAAVAARGMRLDQVVAAIAAAAGISADPPGGTLGAGELLQALRSGAPGTTPFVVVVDALDEAGGTAATGSMSEATLIARSLLRPLGTLPGVRLIVGTRRELLPALSPAMVEIDLDDPLLAEPGDIADYVRRLLLAEDDPESPTPYRDDPGLADIVAAGIAKRADRNFLIARMHALRLVYAADPVEVSRQGWQLDLKSDIGAVFDDYLARFGSDADRVRRLLTPLAFTEGQGLPWDDLWAPLATALSGATCTDEDVAWLLDHASSYVVEATEGERSVYRLYHQALADHLRKRLPAREAHRRFTRTLQATVPRLPAARTPTGPPATAGDSRADWVAAHIYIRDNLALHAAASGLLDSLLADPGFILAADVGNLIGVLPRASTDQARLVAAVAERAVPYLISTAPSDRAGYLQLIARSYGANRFADAIDAFIAGQSWSVPWADTVPRTPHRVIGHHSSPITAIAVTSLQDHGVVAAAGNDRGGVVLWDVEDAQGLAAVYLDQGIGGLAIAELAEWRRLALLSAGDDCWSWDLAAETLSRIEVSPPLDCSGPIAIAKPGDGRVVGLIGQEDGSVILYDVERAVVAGKLEYLPSGKSREQVGNIVSVKLADGRDIVIASHEWTEKLTVWDLATGARLSDWPTGMHWAEGLAAATMPDGRRLVLASGDGSIQLWEAAAGTLIGEFYDATRISAATISATGKPLLAAVLARSQPHQRYAAVWSLDEVAAACEPITTDDLIDKMIDAANAGLGDGDSSPLLKIEQLALAVARNRADVELPGPVIAIADVVVRDGNHTSVAYAKGGRIRAWPAGNRAREDSRSRSSGKSPEIESILPVSYELNFSNQKAHVNLWVLSTGQVRQELAGHEDRITAVALARLRDGRDIVITGGIDRTIRQ